jgi:hypothetical protein
VNKTVQKPQALDEIATPWMARNSPRFQVKAPFRLTLMNRNSFAPLFWVWSRKGRQWVVEQAMHLIV